MNKSINGDFFVPKNGDKFRILPKIIPVDHINLYEPINVHIANHERMMEINLMIKDMARIQRLSHEDKNMYLSEIFSYVTQ